MSRVGVVGGAVGAGDVVEGDVGRPPVRRRGRNFDGRSWAVELTARSPDVV